MAVSSQYDVIVAGAGPAGLSIASELSRFVRVQCPVIHVRSYRCN